MKNCNLFIVFFFFHAQPNIKIKIKTAFRLINIIIFFLLKNCNNFNYMKLLIVTHPINYRSIYISKMKLMQKLSIQLAQINVNHIAINIILFVYKCVVCSVHLHVQKQKKKICREFY